MRTLDRELSFQHEAYKNKSVKKTLKNDESGDTSAGMYSAEGTGQRGTHTNTYDPDDSIL